MRFIEIQDGVSINVNLIEGIKKLDNGNCEIYAHHRKYLSVFPYETMFSILRKDDMNEKTDSTIDRLNKVLNNEQYFAG